MTSKQEMETATLAYAQYLGVDLDSEPELVHIAREALKDLPSGWEVCISEEGDSACIPFFHNIYTEESVWNHPQEEVYLRKVKEERRYLKKNKRENEYEKENATKNHSGHRNDRSHSISKSSDHPEDIIDVEDFENDSFNGNGDDRHGFGGNTRDSGYAKEKSNNTRARRRSGSHSDMERSKDHSRDIELDNGSRSPIFGDNWLDESAANPKYPDSGRIDGRGRVAERERHDRGLDMSRELGKDGNYDIRDEGGRGWNTDGRERNSRDRERENRSRDERERNRGWDQGVVDDWRGEQWEGSGGDRRDDSRDFEGGKTRLWERDSESPVGRQSAADVRGQRKSAAYESKPERDYRDNLRGGSPVEDYRDKASSGGKANGPNHSAPLWVNTAEATSGEGSGWPSNSGLNTGVSTTGTGLESTSRLHSEVKRLQDEIVNLRSQHKMEVQEMNLVAESLRSSLHVSEEALHTERSLKKKSEDLVRELQSQLESMRLDAQTASSSASVASEEAKRLEIERVSTRITEEWKDKLRNATQNHQSELEAEHEVVRVLKQRLAEEEDKVRATQRQLVVVREEMRIEASQEAEKLKNDLVETESRLKTQGHELQRVKEEYTSMASRAASALQQAQAAKAEMEALRAETTAIASDGHTSHAALMQALQRIQQYESEIVRVKAEKNAIQQELDTQFAELRKYQDASISKDGKVQMTDLELKRTRTQFQSELSRLKSRVAELEGTNVVLQDQLDRTVASESNESREIQRQLDRSEHEVSRLQGRLQDSEERVRDVQNRCQSLEKELLSLQDTIFKRDRTVKDLNAKAEVLASQKEELRFSMEAELEAVKQELRAEKQNADEVTRRYQKEFSDMRKDVESRIPQLTADVAEQAESHYRDQLQTELRALGLKHQRQIESLKQEMIHMQTSHSEAIARYKASASEEKIELERLRQKCQLLESRNRDMEVLVDNLRQKEHHSLIQHNTIPILGTTYRQDISTYDDPHGPVARAGAADDAAVASVSSQLAEMRKQLSESLALTRQSQTRRERMQSSRPAYIEESSDPDDSLTSNRAAQKTRSAPGRNIRKGNAGVGGTSPPPATIKRTAYSPEVLFNSPPYKSAAVIDHSSVQQPVMPHKSDLNSLYESVDQSYHLSYEQDYSAIRLPNSPDGLPISDQDFSSIQDGGFHEGYWKAKYLRSQNL
mmetsp:Transcript_3873/g.6047  ORF Transcript_3873/g.6047 Transcript_3873/m.6047 type:complete len:1186 (-) Transcript_3873:128-3685(-)|eukprot:CAMPEP_0185038624 /NCGR_PEP_ID=MMETSP1103-20130426/34499_1 /TAXON_ID=36769 /ORGANISM="Paraphysomonas bandaiensis, Strain Caron Lab Isolate" /LENGTH=1185 /DNA_ID=CAMNT_0027577141 /DNA_START=102 /DNA_END=3659 /DNA_ORIENTATION=+